jgi:hypothetical protein
VSHLRARSPLSWQEAVDAFREFLQIAEDAGLEPVEARIATPAPPEDFVLIHIRLAEENKDPAVTELVTLTLDRIENRARELGLHVRRSVYLILLTA